MLALALSGGITYASSGVAGVVHVVQKAAKPAKTSSAQEARSAARSAAKKAPAAKKGAAKKGPVPLPKAAKAHAGGSADGLPAGGGPSAAGHEYGHPPSTPTPNTSPTACYHYGDLGYDSVELCRAMVHALISGVPQPCWHGGWLLFHFASEADCIHFVRQNASP